MSEIRDDKWVHRSANMRCITCMWYVPKLVKNKQLAGEQSYSEAVGRCRRHAPTTNGYPVVFQDDWCGDHKLDENKI